MTTRTTKSTASAPDERRPLDEGSIVDAALDIVRAGGVQELSMRTLTQRLGVAVGATYRHVAGKEELLEACARRIYEQVVDGPRPADADPMVWVRDLIIRLIEVLGDYPGLAPWVVQHGRLDATRLTPAVMEALTASGLGPEETRRTMHVLFFFIQGALLTDYRKIMLSVGVTDYADQLRLDIDHILAPRVLAPKPAARTRKSARIRPA